MKTIIKNILLLAIVFIPSLSLVISCSDDDDNGDGSTPVIRYVRATDVATSDSLITSALLGSTVAIIGENFSDVKEVWFDDLVTKVNPGYVTNNAILVTIPGVIPTEQTNQMKLVTKSGKTILHDFKVDVPAPTLASLKCEQVPDGETVVIYGNYFVDPKVYFAGNTEAEIVEYSETELQIKVPIGAKGGPITVKSRYGTTRSTFIFRDSESLTPTTKLFLDFEDTSWNNWNRGEFVSEDGITGKYLRFNGSASSWAWPTDKLQLYYNNPTRQPIVTEGEIEDLALRFEFNSQEWHDISLMIWFSNLLETHSVDGEEAQAHWKPYLKNGVKSDYNTDGWVTVTIPLSDFKYDKEEKTSRSINSLNELVDLHIILYGPSDDDKTYNANIWMDNFRIVKYK